MEEAYAVSIRNVTKIYRLYARQRDRMKDMLGLAHKKNYTEHYALDDVSFDVRRGETVGMIGTNGSGKSTMLKIITGVLTATSGEVRIDGRISALLELGAGFNMEYTGLENVYLNGTMIGFSKEEVDERLQDILEFADIGDFIYQPVKSYSSGMFVRLAFAVAINIDPEILIVDEALSVGDVFFQAKCYKKFEDFKKQGKTILFVSHDLSSISKYCDRVVLLNNGKKLAEGRPRQMIDLYKKVLTRQIDDDGNEIAVRNTAQHLAVGEVWKEHFPINPDWSDYGDKRIEIIDFATMDKDGNYTATLIKGEEFTLKMKVQIKEDLPLPIFAFTIKDRKGNDITGTNTMYEKQDIRYEVGDVKVISFTQKMNLQGGEYLVSLGCTGYGRNSELEVYHRLYDVFRITVISTKDTVGYFDMFSKVKVEQA